MSSLILDNLSDEDKRIIARLCGDIPDSEEPFQLLSQELGIEEHELMRKIRDWKRNGIIRKFGAILAHNLIGYKYNAMVVWRVPGERVPEIGKVAASFPEVSHCYERGGVEWPYNLFMVIHGYTKVECERVIKEISSKTGLRDYEILYSTREFKKSSMKYFLGQVGKTTL